MWRAIRRSRIATLALASGAIPRIKSGVIAPVQCYMPECGSGVRSATGDSEGVLDTYPRRLWGVRKSACRGLRRDVDGAIHRFMWPRSAPGRRANGSRSRRLAATVVGDRPVMAWSRRPLLRGTWPKGPQICSDAQNRRRGCRKATPGAVRPLGASDGSPRRPTRVSWGSDEEPPGCRVGTRVPVAPPAVRRGTDGAWARERE